MRQQRRLTLTVLTPGTLTFITLLKKYAKSYVRSCTTRLDLLPNCGLVTAAQRQGNQDKDVDDSDRHGPSFFPQ